VTARTGRVALVTGGNRGIGLEVARQLATAGDTVVLGARHPARGEAAADELAAGGLDVQSLELDVTDPASANGAATTVGERSGRLDVLVNNAAIHYDTWQQGRQRTSQSCETRSTPTCSGRGR